jgi:AraC-like DNA-binding protein
MNYGPDATPDLLLPRCLQSRSARRAREACRLGDVVQQIVTRLLREGYPDVHSVATMLGLTTRTLQRRLSEEGVTYAGVVARARFDVAQRMLEDPACKIIEVALDLGYSDPAHFARAFARWTGLTPREFRRLRATGCRGDAFPHENFVSAGAPRHDARDDHGRTAITVPTSRELRWAPVIEVKSSDQAARARAGRQEERRR